MVASYYRLFSPLSPSLFLFAVLSHPTSTVTTVVVVAAVDVIPVVIIVATVVTVAIEAVTTAVTTLIIVLIATVSAILAVSANGDYITPLHLLFIACLQRLTPSWPIIPNYLRHTNYQYRYQYEHRILETRCTLHF